MGDELCGKVAVEFFGTAFFLGAILLTAGMQMQVPLVGAALVVALYVGSLFNGDGNFNPAVTTMILSSGGMDATKWLAFVTAQVAGGLAASAGVSAVLKNA